MSLRIPNFFKVKTAVEARTPMDLNHNITTTTDFFRVQPVLCREMVPHDKFNCSIESFARFTPMPFPTIGQIKFINRCFFVPYRMIFEGFDDFIEENPSVMADSLILHQFVPNITMSKFCSMFEKEENSEVIYDVSWKLRYDTNGTKIYYLCDPEGKVMVFNDVEPRVLQRTIKGEVDQLYFERLRSFPTDGVLVGDFSYSQGIYTISVDPFWDNYLAYTLKGDVTQSITSLTFNLSTLVLSYGQGNIAVASSFPYRDDVAFDFVDRNNLYRRFTNAGRKRYNLLLSLGYRVDFSSNNGVYTSIKQRSLGKLLAYLRVYLDYYANPQFAGYKEFYTYFKNRIHEAASAWSVDDLNAITSFATGFYDKDYFTAAWQNPATPNSDNFTRQYTIVDQYSPNDTDQDDSVVITEQSTFNNSRPRLWLGAHNSFSQYLIDALKDLQMYMNRHQLAGFRTVDRYLAEFGVKLSDDRAGRCYYLGSNEFSAQIGDVMATSETAEAKLGDYAGKAIAYSDSRKFDFETDSYGYFIVVSSCVPSIGYVQGDDRENMHLTPLDFHRAQFDNLGTQAIENSELFDDYGMASPDGNGLVTRPQDFESQGVFGFIPRYAEYKVGRDYLTGDFAIPSRRQGMDSFHLYRLFSGREDINLTNSFTQGEQEQYDRVFNNTSAEYDHIYMTHRVDIKALRPMKSISETIAWDDDLGRTVEIPSGGTQFN